MLSAFVRIVAGIVLGFIGWQAGPDTRQLLSIPAEYELMVSTGVGITGMLVGLLATPFLILDPLHRLFEAAVRVPTDELIAGGMGLLMALVASALLAVPLSRLPSYLGSVAPFFAAIALAYLGVRIMVARYRDVERRLHLPWASPARSEDAVFGMLLDTSAIIDGRIVDVCQTGFVNGTMIVPRFVLEELQRVADSSDTQRRARGRRGLEMLNRLQREAMVPIRIIDQDVEGANGVDTKLVKMARQMKWAIVTSDFNLNRVAALQGVRALNVNELANAIRQVYLPGEEFSVRVVQEGKEHGQGVGYLDDGTMVVIEDAKRLLGSDTEVVVTRVLQTTAGRMIFAHLRDN